MKAKKYFIGLLLLFLALSSSFAGYKTIVYSAYVNNDMRLWKKTIDDMQALKNGNNAFILELVNYQYGYIGWCLSTGKEDEAEYYLDLAEVQVELLGKKGYMKAQLEAYRAAFCGFRIGISSWKAPVLGPKCINFAKSAMALDKTNPYGYIQYGNAQYNMPEVFGGSKKLAIEYFLKAEKLMEATPAALSYDWNYLGLLTQIAMAYEAIGANTSARAYYEKVLKLEPNLFMVKNQLYPNILKKLK